MPSNILDPAVAAVAVAMAAVARVVAAVALVAVASGLAGCAGGQRPDGHATRYRKGDHVVYRYSGLFTPAPVTLREEVTRRRGNELTIDVTATRGDERRRWIQVVTDSPENQAGNVVDALYEFVEGERVLLENEDNADLMRLYDWMMVSPDTPLVDMTTAEVETRFLGHTFNCIRTSGRSTWQGRPMQVEAHQCPGFMWTHGPAEFRHTDTGETILEIEVLEAGSSKP